MSRFSRITSALQDTIMKKNTLIPGKSSNAADANLEEKALSRFKAGQYKEAIELYKTLLKNSDNSEWRQTLAECYLQRARSFADKGMVKEALVLWENYAQNAAAPHEGRDCYISWLLQTNDMAKAKKALSQLSAQQVDEQYPELAALLGLLIISGKTELEAVLPKDSVFITHLGLVQAALSAYRQNKPEDIESVLKQLPFRSAFRDFRTLMKAALALPESPQQVQTQLAKIPSASPYNRSSQVLTSLTHNGAALVNDLMQFTRPQIQIVETALKLSKKQVELLDILSKQKDNLSDKLKFNLAIQYQTLFDANAAQNYCLTALASYPAGQRDFSKHFGAMDSFEQSRLKALSSERNDDLHGANYYWKQCIAALKTQGSAGNFKIALIMRHIAAHAGSPDDTIDYLTDSLEYDPSDRETYLKILRYYDDHTQDDESFKKWLDKSIKQFPLDVDFLSLAIKASTRRKAHKKAVQYANNLLKIDPVNTFAKQVLLSSHLAHAKKLIRTKKLHLVEQEIRQAESIKLGKRYQTMVAVMRGFFVFVAEDKKKGLQLLGDALEKPDDGLFNSHFYLTMEALLLDLAVTPIVKALPPLDKDAVLSQQELLKLTQLIQRYMDDDSGNQTRLHKALDKHKAVIKRSVSRIQDEPTLLAICQCLDSIRHFELMRYCIKIVWAAQLFWNKPIWMYYKVYSEANGDPDKCSNMNLYRLQDSLNLARQQNDQRTVMLIDKFLEHYYKSHSPSGFDMLDKLFGGTEEFDDPLEALFNDLPDELYHKLGKKTVEIIQKNSPEKMIKLLAAQYLNNDIALMNKLFSNLDVVNAFLMLKAADDLGINIDVSADDIVKCYNNMANEKPRLFPFF